MRPRRFPGPLDRILHAALDRLSLHHVAHQATRRGYMLCDDAPDEDGCPVDDHDLETAEEHFRRGDDAEALIWLERALPDGFAGLADRLVPRGRPA